MIKAILFDVGGVLLTVRGEDLRKKWYESLGIDWEVGEAFYKKNDPDLRLGGLSFQAFAQKMEHELGLKAVEQRYREVRKELVGVNQEVMAFAKALMGKYRVGIMTNAIDISFEMNTALGVYDGFDPVVVSSRIGIKKPSREIYEHTLRLLGLQAEECVFIDDREGHLVAPKDMGFHTLLFQGLQGLQAEFQKLGVRF